MTIAAPIPLSLEVVEDALLAAVRDSLPVPPYGLAEVGSWGRAPADTARRLFLDPLEDAEALRYAIVLQHQDGGGSPDYRLNSAGRQHLIVVKAMSADDEIAKEGHAVAMAALADVVSPAGHRIALTFDRRVVVPTLDDIATRASQWRVVVRRTA